MQQARYLVVEVHHSLGHPRRIELGLGGQIQVVDKRSGFEDCLLGFDEEFPSLPVSVQSSCREIGLTAGIGVTKRGSYGLIAGGYLC